MSKAIDSYAGSVNKIRQLLSGWLQSGVDLFLELRRVDEGGIWRNGQHATFAEFLSREFPEVIGLNRYEHVIKAIDLYGMATIRTHGVEVCHALISPRVTSEPKRVAMVQASLAEHVRTNKVPVTPLEARKIVAGIAEETAPLANSTKRVNQRSEEQKTIAELRGKLQAANKRIRELETELKKSKIALELATNTSTLYRVNSL